MRDEKSSDHRASIRVATWLVASGLVYNVLEAVVALWSGNQADSVALIGFGLDSIIETMASGVLLWHLWRRAHPSDGAVPENKERNVHRFVGGTFLALVL